MERPVAVRPKKLLKEHIVCLRMNIRLLVFFTAGYFKDLNSKVAGRHW